MNMKAGWIGFTFLCASSVGMALPAPEYLSVPQWKSCVSTVAKGSAEFVCLPVEKPSACPASSWDALKDRSLIESCP